MSKKRFYKVVIVCLCLAIIMVGICSCGGGVKKYSVVYTDIFDTVTEFTAYCRNEAEFNAAKAAVYDELLRLHRLFDIYNEYDGITNLSIVNKTASSAPVLVSDDIIDLLKLYKHFYEISDGKLNAALGAVLEIWHEYRQDGSSVPDYSELQNASQHTDISDLVIENNTLFFKDPQLKLDVGAVAKGYAAQKAADLAKEKGLSDFALNLGGNVVTSGQKPTGPWSIGIQNPDGGILTKVSVSDVSVVTSGDYQRYYEVDGIKYHHIIDPETLYPASYFRSVTVICKNSAQADALSTALFCMDEKAGEQLLKNYDAEALWIKSDGTVIKTGGFSEYE